MKKKVIHTYAAYNYNEIIRLNSSSGGIFTLLAEYVINKKGIVYGVTMSDNCYENYFIRVHNISDLSKLRGSKYIQARVGDTFKKVYNDLNSGLYVLFSGTGCQINGLKSFLQKEYENLICVDVICHGVPSQKIWKKYVEYVEKSNGKLKSINFRSKEKSWQEFGIKENELFISKDDDIFFQFFNRCYCLRPSCYQCVAKSDKRSDITIADYWGIENIIPELNDNKGISLVLIRTDNGNNLFNIVKSGCYYQETSYEDGVRENIAEYMSHDYPKQRETFYYDLDNMSIDKLAIKYLYGPLWKRIGRKIKKFIKYLLLYKFCGGGAYKTNK